MDEPEPILRVARLGDEAQIRVLMQASTAAIFPQYYDAVQTASCLRYLAQPDPALVADSTYFVFEAEDELVGCGGWSRRGRPYMGSADAPDDDRLLDPLTEAAHIRAMFVRPDRTRRGLGRRIIDACEAAARSHGFTRLDLVATLPGVPLYRACGFAAAGPVAPIVLADGVFLPCLAMTKPLDAAKGATGDDDG